MSLTADHISLAGRLLQPGDAGWEAATQAFNLTVVQEPALVALPATDDDVVAIVDYARERGLQVAPQRTGHNAAPLGPLDDVILLRTDALQGVEIDAERRVARVRAGSRWADVLPRASELGLAALHGSTPDVSVAGYALGGGVGWYARKHGLAANSIVRDRAGHGGRRAAARRSRQRPGSVLGAARRRRQLRRRDRHRGAAVPDRRGLRGDAVLPLGARLRSPARMARVDRARCPRKSRPSGASSSSRHSSICRLSCAGGSSRRSTRS